MTADERKKLVERLEEINAEVRGLMPDFMKAGGSQQKARDDAANWRRKLEPLFKEHSEIADKLLSRDD